MTSSCEGGGEEALIQNRRLVTRKVVELPVMKATAKRSSCDCSFDVIQDARTKL